MVPRYLGCFSFGSQRYNEWQTLDFEAATEREEKKPTGNNVSENRTIVDEKVTPRVDPLPRVVNTIEEKGVSVRHPGSPMADVAKKRTGIPIDRMMDRMTRSTIDKWITNRKVSGPWFIRDMSLRRTKEQGISQGKCPDLHQV
uniref:Uncharacterized protein n=1 Tax=Peronospora matthiolae TaxID=2874970 RepID=A0AAV1UTP3_9STRA